MVELPPLLRDTLVAFLGVCLFGAVLFAAAGVWPPMVAVESGSMHPNLQKGDLVVVSATDRYAPRAADEFGVVTARRAGDYARFHEPGDVLVFTPPSWSGSPIIHRARFHVDAGENWYEEANASYLGPGDDSCDALAYCPAPHAGYITKGDHNGRYDQAVGRASPVRPSWVRAKAQVRVPLLGWIRLLFQQAV